MSNDNERNPKHPAEETDESIAKTGEVVDLPQEDDDAPVPDPWRERYEALSPETQNKLQIIGGVVVTLIIGALMYFFNPAEDQPTGFLPSWNYIVALGLALVAPRIVENKLKTTLRMFRRVMLIGVAIIVLGMLVFALAAGKL